MRKYFFTALLPLLLSSCEVEAIVPGQNVPAEITSYLEKHFPKNPVLQTVKDVDGLELTYDITLKEGVFVEFNRSKEVIDIESTTQLRESVIPAKLAEFVAANYSGSFIVGWEKEGRNQQIKLNSGIELEFNSKGEFLRIDSLN